MVFFDPIVRLYGNNYLVVGFLCIRSSDFGVITLSLRKRPILFNLFLCLLQEILTAELVLSPALLMKEVLFQSCLWLKQVMNLQMP